MIDFGKSASDYARFRRGFPDSFFRRLDELGIRGRILDLGTGTGAIARRIGAVGLDRSLTMLCESAGPRVVACAERTPFLDGTFDAVTAGQCWIWFDGPTAARECCRLLRPGGRIVVAHFDYMISPVTEATEEIVLRFNPGWPMAGFDPRHRRDDRIRGQLGNAGFTDFSFAGYDEPVEYSHDAWRGRIRACNGVIAIGDPAKIAALDARLAEALTAFPDPIVIPHRVSILAGRRPPDPVPASSLPLHTSL